MKTIKFLQQFTDRIWYAPLIGFLAALDNLVLIIPTDGVLISSSMLKPKKWLSYAVFVAVGSTIGALILAYLVEEHGLPGTLKYFPNINQTKAWSVTLDFFQMYGLLCVFIISLSPLMQQPVVVLASLAATPYHKLAMAVFAGRFLKYLFMSYVGSHAPKLLSKLWGIEGELQDVGLETKKQ